MIYFKLCYEEEKLKQNYINGFEYWINYQLIKLEAEFQVLAHRRPPNLSELTPIISNIEQTHLGSNYYDN